MTSVDRVPAGSSVEPPSVLLRSVIPDVFSLYRALLPVAHQAAIASGPALAMQAVNDCVWLATQAESLFGSGDASAERLRQAGQRRFTDEVARRVSGVQLILDGAFGFVDVGDEQRGADSESAVADAVARVEELSAAWKVCPLLPRRLIKGRSLLLMSPLLSIPCSPCYLSTARSLRSASSSTAPCGVFSRRSPTLMTLRRRRASG